MKPLKTVSCLFFGLALAVVLALAGCQSDSPTEPSSGTSRPANPQPPDPVVTLAVTVTANPPQLEAGATTPSTVTVEVRRNDNGQPPPDLTEVTLTTNLGSFGSATGGQEVTLQLVNGRAQTNFFAGPEVGTATIRAAVAGNAGVTNIGIGQRSPFFVSSIVPGVGDPEGGENVVINGGGFDPPVRVTFNSATAQVLGVEANRIRVRTPSATAAGVSVPVGSTAPVNVSVTINLNEANVATDQLTNGFTYALGGGGGIDQPEVFSVSPASGVNEGGTTVRIRGTGFRAPVQVFFGLGASTANFNGVEARVDSVTSNEIVVVTPAARGFGQNLVNQLVNLLVRNVNTGFSTISPAAFRYGSDVIITAMGPGSGPFTGGTRVRIFGQGFDAPVSVGLGTPRVAQLVVSTTGTEIEFITSGITVATCPPNGIVAATGVTVTNIETGDTADNAGLTFNYTVPRPLIFGLNPTSGNAPPNPTQVTITGQDFPANPRVTFGGDSSSGASAPILSNTATTIRVSVPTPPPDFEFTTQECDDIPGGETGTRTLPTAISVTVTDLGGTGCATTLANAFTLASPTGNVCVGDTGPPAPTACNDGLDNDGDGLIDFGPGPGNDPGCSSLEDNSEVG